jgi:hypothetical protein
VEIISPADARGRFGASGTSSSLWLGLRNRVRLRLLALLWAEGYEVSVLMVDLLGARIRGCASSSAFLSDPTRDYVLFSSALGA